MSAPTSAATMRPIRIRNLRRSVTGGKRVAGLLLRRGFRLRLGLGLVGPNDAADRATRDAHLDIRRNPHHHVVAGVVRDLAVDAGRREDLVADLDLLEHPLLRLLALL